MNAPTRRALFGAAFALGAAPAIASAPAAGAAAAAQDLPAILSERNRFAVAINESGLLDNLPGPEQEVAFDRLFALENIIDRAPIRSTADIRAKFGLLIQQHAEEVSHDQGWVVSLLRDVVSFLEAN